MDNSNHGIQLFSLIKKITFLFFILFILVMIISILITKYDAQLNLNVIFEFKNFYILKKK